MSAHDASPRAAARRELRAHRRPQSQIPTAGMADIAFLLLIFFMVIVYDADRTRVELPKSEVRLGSDERAALVILSRGDDAVGSVAIRFAGEPTQDSTLLPDLEAVYAEAAHVLADEPGKVFKIKADGRISARMVTRVFDALSRAGAGRVLMLTDPREAGSGGAS